jgi:hypothetical protein
MDLTHQVLNVHLINLKTLKQTMRGNDVVL